MQNNKNEYTNDIFCKVCDLPRTYSPLRKERDEHP
jgi:hypothetical protein